MRSRAALPGKVTIELRTIQIQAAAHLGNRAMVATAQAQVGTEVGKFRIGFVHRFFKFGGVAVQKIVRLFSNQT